MIVKTLTDEYTFWEWQKQSDNYRDQFSLEGAKALFNYFDEYSDETGEPMEFDPIAWLCDFSEYDSAQEAYEEYEGSNADTYNEREALDWLQERTQVIELDNGHILVGAF